MVLEKTLDSPLGCKEIQPVHPKGNKFIYFLKEINSEHSLEGLVLKLKPQYFGNLMGRMDSLEKTWERLKAGGEGYDRG